MEHYCRYFIISHMNPFDFTIDYNDVVSINLVDPKNIVFSRLHFKLGMIKHFVKSFSKERECLKYLYQQFPSLSKAKLK